MVRPKGIDFRLIQPIGPEYLDRKIFPLEFDADVPMVIDICLSISQGCPQKINYKETLP